MLSAWLRDAPRNRHSDDVTDAHAAGGALGHIRWQVGHDDGRMTVVTCRTANVGDHGSHHRHPHKEVRAMSMLLRFDPFREIDRAFEQARTQVTRPSFPMDAYRHGDTFVVHFDLPGVDPASIDLEYERNMLTIAAERSWRPVEGDEVVANERIHGAFRRQLMLGDGLDAAQMHATYENGVLTVTIPVAEKAKPRKVNVEAPGRASAIEANTA
jgi:HSP20 family protein